MKESCMLHRPWGALLREHRERARQQLRLLCREPEERAVRTEVPRPRVRPLPLGLDAIATRARAALAGAIARG